MATYLFQNERSGEVIEYDEPMSAPKLDRKLIDGEWHRRVYTAPATAVVSLEVTKTTAGLPVSRSLPVKFSHEAKPVCEYGRTVWQHPDGTKTDRKGRQIVATRKDVERLAHQGFTRET